MGDPASRVSRVRAGAPHKSTLVTTWRVKVTGIEFIKDVYMSENGNNLSSKAPDAVSYPEIKENFHGWGRGPYLTGWDWQGSDNLERAACYIRLKPIVMKVRLRCALPAPSARTFVLVVAPTLNDDATFVTSGSKSVDWAAGSLEQEVEITTGGALPDEVSRYDLRLTWSVKDIAVSAADGTTHSGIAGVINRSRHTIFSIYDLPRESSENSEGGRDFYFDSGLTKQRLDKITQVLNSKRRFPTAKASDLDELVWLVHKDVNNAHDPPYFEGERSFKIKYNLKPDRKLKRSKDPIEIGLVDQWIMWAPSGGGYNGPFPHWNYGACITYIQLMKTMLAMIGIHARLAWVIPKTTQLPTIDTPITLSESDVVDFDSHNPDLPTQKHEFTGKSGAKWEAEVVLMERPEKGGWEQFEGCLYYNKRFYPGAIPVTKYPDSLQRNHLGFNSALDVLRWWITVSHGKFQRFMVWKAEKPTLLFFDINGDAYIDAYKILHDDQLLFGQ
jgi:hypothetical protein